MPEAKDGLPEIESLSDVVRTHILLVCVRCNWSIYRAAKLLGVCEKTIYNHLNRYEQQGFIERGPHGWRVKDHKETASHGQDRAHRGVGPTADQTPATAG